MREIGPWKESSNTHLRSTYIVYHRKVNRLKDSQKLYVFGRYEDYNTYASGNKKVAYEFDHVKRMAVGLNYMPIPQIIIKAEYAKRFLAEEYNNEPSLSIGIAFVGWFNR